MDCTFPVPIPPFTKTQYLTLQPRVLPFMGFMTLAQAQRTVTGIRFSILIQITPIQPFMAFTLRQEQAIMCIIISVLCKSKWVNLQKKNEKSRKNVKKKKSYEKAGTVYLVNSSIF